MVRILKNSFLDNQYNYPYEDPKMIIEKAVGRVVKKGGFKWSEVKELGVEGYRGDIKEYVEK